MWRQIIALGRKFFFLTQKVERHDAELEKLRGQVRDLNATVHEVIVALREMHAQRENDQAMAARDRENLLLRLENHLLRAGHQPLPDSDIAAPELGNRPQP